MSSSHDPPALDLAHQPPCSLKRLWRLGGLSWWRLLTECGQVFFRQRISGRSAQLAYYSLLATAPLLILLIAGATVLPGEGVLQSFMQAVEVGMPNNVSQLIREQIAGIPKATSWSVTFSAAFLMGLSGSRVFMTLGESLDAAYGVNQSRTFLKAKAVSILMSYLLLLLILLAMLALVFGPKIAQTILVQLDLDWMKTATYHLIRWGIAAGFMLTASSLLYWIVPTGKHRWYPLSPGSVVATIGWVGTTIGMATYVDRFHRFNETYGSLGAFIALLMWFQLTGVFLLLGGVVNGVILRAATRSAEPNQSNG